MLSRSIGEDWQTCATDHCLSWRDTEKQIIRTRESTNEVSCLRSRILDTTGFYQNYKNKYSHINREWKEGILSSAVISTGNSATWVIFNGDVEPEWAEALNSALDDNRLLTLPNGIGIKLGIDTR